jgi:transposase
VRRFPTKAHFASYSTTAAVETSSGEVVRHRLSLAGNRKLKVTPCTWSLSAKRQVGRSG